MHCSFMFDLISATVAKMTACRYTIEVIDIERAAVSHLDTDDPVTTV